MRGGYIWMLCMVGIWRVVGGQFVFNPRKGSPSVLVVGSFGTAMDDTAREAIKSLSNVAIEAPASRPSSGLWPRGPAWERCLAPYWERRDNCSVAGWHGESVGGAHHCAGATLLQSVPVLHENHPIHGSGSWVQDWRKDHRYGGKLLRPPPQKPWDVLKTVAGGYRSCVLAGTSMLAYWPWVLGSIPSNKPIGIIFLRSGNNGRGQRELDVMLESQGGVLSFRQIALLAQLNWNPELDPLGTAARKAASSHTLLPHASHFTEQSFLHALSHVKANVKVLVIGETEQKEEFGGWGDEEEVQGEGVEKGRRGWVLTRLGRLKVRAFAKRFSGNCNRGEPRDLDGFLTAKHQVTINKPKLKWPGEPWLAPTIPSQALQSNFGGQTTMATWITPERCARWAQEQREPLRLGIATVYDQPGRSLEALASSLAVMRTAKVQGGLWLGLADRFVLFNSELDIAPATTSPRAAQGNLNGAVGKGVVKVLFEAEGAKGVGAPWFLRCQPGGDEARCQGEAATKGYVSIWAMKQHTIALGALAQLDRLWYADTDVVFATSADALLVMPRGDIVAATETDWELAHATRSKCNPTLMKLWGNLGDSSCNGVPTTPTGYGIFASVANAVTATLSPSASIDDHIRALTSFFQTNLPTPSCDHQRPTNPSGPDWRSPLPAKHPPWANSIMRRGKLAPVNGGVFVTTPSCEAYVDIYEMQHGSCTGPYGEYYSNMAAKAPYGDLNVVPDKVNMEPLRQNVQGRRKGGASTSPSSQAPSLHPPNSAVGTLERECSLEGLHATAALRFNEGTSRKVWNLWHDAAIASFRRGFLRPGHPIDGVDPLDPADLGQRAVDRDYHPPLPRDYRWGIYKHAEEEQGVLAMVPAEVHRDVLHLDKLSEPLLFGQHLAGPAKKAALKGWEGDLRQVLQGVNLEYHGPQIEFPHTRIPKLFQEPLSYKDTYKAYKTAMVRTAADIVAFVRAHPNTRRNLRADVRDDDYTPVSKTDDVGSKDDDDVDDDVDDDDAVPFDDDTDGDDDAPRVVVDDNDNDDDDGSVGSDDNDDDSTADDEVKWKKGVMNRKSTKHFEISPTQVRAVLMGRENALRVVDAEVAASAWSACHKIEPKRMVGDSPGAWQARIDTQLKPGPWKGQRIPLPSAFGVPELTVHVPSDLSGVAPLDYASLHALLPFIIDAPHPAASRLLCGAAAPPRLLLERLISSCLIARGISGGKWTDEDKTFAFP